MALIDDLGVSSPPENDGSLLSQLGENVDTPSASTAVQNQPTNPTINPGDLQTPKDYFTPGSPDFNPGQGLSTAIGRTATTAVNTAIPNAQARQAIQTPLQLAGNVIEAPARGVKGLAYGIQQQGNELDTNGRPVVNPLQYASEGFFNRKTDI